MYAVKATLDFTGDWDRFERASIRLREPRELMRAVGVLGMSSSHDRLQTHVSSREGISTGMLGASLQATEQGAGGADTIFEVWANSVEVGSRVVYAAIRNFGGWIRPIPPGKALAIPLLERIKRSGVSPSEADPSREIYEFVPVPGGGAKGNVIGLLVDTENQFGARGGEVGEAHYVLVSEVYQEGWRFMGWDDGDERTIEEDLWPKFLQ
jgi:phage gpG-like protein